ASFARGFDRGGEAIEQTGEVIEELLIRERPCPAVLPSQDRPPLEDVLSMHAQRGREVLGLLPVLRFRTRPHAQKLRRPLRERPAKPQQRKRSSRLRVRMIRDESGGVNSVTDTRVAMALAI